MSKELRQFSIFDGCTANPNLVQTKGRPIAYSENVKVIELTPEVSRKLELFDEFVDLVDMLLDHSMCQAFSNEDYREWKEKVKRAKGE